MDARFLDNVTTDIIHYESKKVISSASIHRGELITCLSSFTIRGISLPLWKSTPRLGLTTLSRPPPSNSRSLPQVL